MSNDELDQRNDDHYPSSRRQQKNEVFWPLLSAFLDFTAKYLAIFLAIFTLFGTLIGGGFALNRIEEMINRAENRIATIIGQIAPQSASVHGILGTTDSLIRFRVNIEPVKIADTSFYRLSGHGGLKVSIEGAPGQLIGYHRRAEGPFVDLLSVDPYGAKDIIRALNFNTFQSEYLSGQEHITVTEKTPMSIEYSFSTIFDVCQAAHDVANAIIVKNVDENRMEFKPIFLSIEREPMPKSFSVEFFPGSLIKCIDNKE